MPAPSLNTTPTRRRSTQSSGSRRRHRSDLLRAPSMSCTLNAPPDTQDAESLAAACTTLSALGGDGESLARVEQIHEQSSSGQPRRRCRWRSRLDGVDMRSGDQPGTRMTLGACECGHRCRYAAENNLDPQSERLRAW